MCIEAFHLLGQGLIEVTAWGPRHARLQDAALDAVAVLRGPDGVRPEGGAAVQRQHQVDGLAGVAAAAEERGEPPHCADRSWHNISTLRQRHFRTAQWCPTVPDNARGTRRWGAEGYV